MEAESDAGPSPLPPGLDLFDLQLEWTWSPLQQRNTSRPKVGASGAAADLSRGRRGEGAEGPGGLWRSD